MDTLVLVGALNPKDGLHKEALRHLESLSGDSETFLPVSCAFEFDLVLKGRSYTLKERENALEWLSYSVPDDKLSCNSLPSLRAAIRLQEKGMGYFDSMIASLALESGAVVVTKDREISEVVRTEW
ncbi:MAG: PIN domain-containing protein [Thaumarchaeota archaeon]|nr:PIN domain-containing protein [Nitrososphaerota archaeon]